MNRIGHDSRPNSATKPTSWPGVMAPVETRHAPTAMQERAAERREGVERRPRTWPGPCPPRPARARSSSARSPSLRRLGVLAPERLHDERAVDRLVGHRRDLADPLLGALGRSLDALGERPVHHRERREQQRAHERQPRVGQQQRDHREDRERDHAGGERDRPEHVDRRLHVGLHVREQLAGGRLAVVLELELAVAVGDPPAERRHHALARHAAVVPADHDPDRAERAADDQRDHGEPDGVGVDRPAERRQQHLVGRAPERRGQGDRRDGEQHRARDGRGERLGVHPDVRLDRAGRHGGTGPGPPGRRALRRSASRRTWPL